MRLPNHKLAVVPESKIIDYLLSKSHPKGKIKSAFFTSFGFRADEWQIFAAALIVHAAENEVANAVMTERGRYYAVEGPLTTPDGRDPLIRSVWAIELNSPVPRLVTAYPLD